MPSVIFSHPRIQPPLEISVNPDQVTWAYGLNTAVYPTYGGEVVQILSVYFDDMTVTGTVSSTAELERIYMWFIAYMQDATQGRYGASYDQVPVTFQYPARGWSFQIWPTGLPGFTYGRDVIAPTWKLIAAVKEPDATFADQLRSYATFNAAHKGEFATFGAATADFGTTGDLVNNPWASPDADPSRKDQSMSSFASSQASKLADSFVGFTQSYNSGDLSTLPQFPDISTAAGTTPSSSGKRSQQGSVKH